MGTIVPNSGLVSRVYFNSSLSTAVTTSLLKKLTYIETPLYPFPLNVLLATEDFSKVVAVCKAPYDNGTEDYDILEITNFGQDTQDVKTLFATMITQPSASGWRVTNDYILVLNKNVISEYMGIPIGNENELITDLISVTEFSPELNEDPKVPNSGYVKNVYYGTTLSNPEVLEALKSLEYTYTSNFTYNYVNVLMASENDGVVIYAYKDNTHYGIRESRNWDTTEMVETELYRSHGTSIDRDGWQVDRTYHTEVLQEVKDTITDPVGGSLKVGESNEFITNLISVNPIPIPLKQLLFEVADAIREKKGTLEPINVLNFGKNIKNIPTLKTLLDATQSTLQYFKNYKGTNIECLISYSDTSNVTNMGEMFYDCNNLTTIPLLNTSKVTNMGGMFRGCYNLTTIPSLDTSNAEYMNAMFYGCSKLTTIPALDTSKVTNMNSTFYGCKALTTIPALDTSNVNNMYNMFYNCNNLTTIPALDTSKVTQMGGMFQYCTNLTTILALDTSKVTNINAMFAACNSLTSIPQLDLSSTNDIQRMFEGCYNLTTIPLLNTSNITRMSSTFQGCKALTTIPALDTSKVTNMQSMFEGCTSLTTIPALDTSKVVYFTNIFKNCGSLKSILMYGMKEGFDISASTQFEREDLVTILNNLATVTSSKTLKMGSTNLAKLTDEDKAIATNKGWTLA